MTRVVFLVPRRRDNGHRDALWAYTRARWSSLFPDWDIAEGHHDDGPFNRSAAVNLASDIAGDWDVGIVIDSDVMISESLLRSAVDLAVKTDKVTWPHTRIRNISEYWTKRVILDPPLPAELDRDALDLMVERTNPISWSCCIVIPRSQYDALGGFDERFKGWGFEDMAFQSAVCGLLGWNRQPGDIVHLWHPRSDERIVPGRPRETSSPEYLYNARLGRRYMLALRRDHALHDRSDTATAEEERLRDIENLKRDDAKWSAVARRMGMPNWDSWWPTLEELVAGARAYRASDGHRQAVTVVVRSGGTLEVADERLGYLDRSLASLEASITGEVVQRVVYSDWPDEVAERLREIAARHGYYVAGSGHNGYIGSTQRLWRYIANRAVADYVFLAEDDFIYIEPIDLPRMVTALEARPSLRQIALLREAAYPREVEHPGILGWERDSFTQAGRNGTSWLEHRNFWTMNPSLMRKSLVSNFPWPNEANSERLFGNKVLKDPDARVAFWGTGTPSMRHIGETRAGGPY